MYSRSIPQRFSLSWITTRKRMDRTKVQRLIWICTRRRYISTHSKRTEKIPRTMVSHFEQVRQKRAYETSIRFSSCCLYQKSSTPRVWMELEMSSLDFLCDFFDTVGFVYSRWRSTVTDGVCRQIHLTRDLLDTFILVRTSHCGSRCRTTCLHKTCSSTCHHMSIRNCISHCMAQDEPPTVSVARTHSIFMTSMMCAWAFVVCLFVLFLLLFLSVVYLFSSSIYTDNSLEFGKACEDLSWNHCTSTPYRSETNGIAERGVRKVKEETSAVLLQSGLIE